MIKTEEKVQDKPMIEKGDCKMGKKLVAYYSRADENYVGGQLKNLKVGNTQVAAEMIQKLTGADSFRIEQAKPYAAGYNECIEQAREDQRRDARPELKAHPESIAEYDEIYLGYPNYWSTMPMAVFTFLEHFDFTGKTIRPFCTHEGSGMGSSEADIRKLCKGAVIKKGLAARGGSTAQAGKEIERWISEEE